MSRSPFRSLPRLPMLLLALAALCVLPAAAGAQSPPAGSQKRIALVVGNAAYAAAPLSTAANDAGLVAQTLQAAGFDVVGARDLDEDSLRRALRDFADKAAASGPDTVSFVYLAGYGVQLDGENYIVPVDARIASAADVPTAALRVSDYTKRLAALPLKARFVVLDAARANPFAKGGEPLAGGLALTEADPGSLVAFNAAPGTVGPVETGSYGAYAEALVEMIREGGLQPAELFDRVRLRVSERTGGGLVPWDASRIEAPFVFFERAPDAPPAGRPAEVAALRARPIREIGAQDAFALCLERDTLQGYQDFLAAYPQDPLAKRVRAILAARREALTWRRTLVAGSPEAFWSYLGRYPRGPHAADARRRLSRLAAALEPPPSYTPMVFDVPPPPPEEIVYVERPALYFDDPVYAFAPPPPPPVFFLPPRPAYIVALAPPPPPDEYYALPVPAFVPVPTYVSAPVYVAPPPNAVLYENIHNTTVINQINAAALQHGPALSPGVAIGAGAVVGAAAGFAAARVALPPSVAQKAALPPGGGQPGLGQIGPGQAGPGQVFHGHAPGQAGPGQAGPGQMGPGQGAPGQVQGPAQIFQGQGKGLAPAAAPAQGLPVQAGRPGQPPGQALPGFNGGQPLPQQAGRPGVPGAATGPGKTPAPAAGPGQIPMQAIGQGPGQAAGQGLKGPGIATGQQGAPAPVQGAVPRPGRAPGQPAAVSGPANAAKIPPAPAGDPRQAAQQQKLQAAQERQQAIAQQRQMQAQQRQQQMQSQAAQQQAASQRQQMQAARQQQQMQQQAVRQQQMQQQQAARQQQMMQQRQMQMQQQQAARQQQMQAQAAARQQQMMQQRQMMMQQRAAPAPRAPPPQAGRCPPGQHCR